MEKTVQLATPSIQAPSPVIKQAFSTVTARAANRSLKIEASSCTGLKLRAWSDT